MSIFLSISYSCVRNNIDDITQVQYLCLCPRLRRLALDGNPLCVSPSPTHDQVNKVISRFFCSSLPLPASFKTLFSLSCRTCKEIKCDFRLKLLNLCVSSQATTTAPRWRNVCRVCWYWMTSDSTLRALQPWNTTFSTQTGLIWRSCNKTLSYRALSTNQTQPRPVRKVTFLTFLLLIGVKSSWHFNTPILILLRSQSNDLFKL